MPRADEIAAKFFGISRNKASELIKSGSILLNGCELKPATNVDESVEFQLLGDVFVSRGALKLSGFLEKINIKIAGKNALDIGSSTGGFAQVLLKNGAKSVVCVDVGSEQLHASLRCDEKIELFENTDIRDFASSCEREFDVISADISFVSLALILPSIKKLAKDDIIVLFKPQFEVGKEAKRNKKGVVSDKKAVESAIMAFERSAMSLGFVLLKKCESELKGKNGNQEFFYHFKIVK